MQHGVIMGGQPFGLSLEEKLLPQYLKEMGYATHAVGKVWMYNRAYGMAVLLGIHFPVVVLRLVCVYVSGRHGGIVITASIPGLKLSLGWLCCVLRQETFPSQCLSQPRCTCLMLGPVTLQGIKVKPWSQRWLIAAGAYPGFCSMKRLEVFLLLLDRMLVHRRSLPRNFR